MNLFKRNISKNSERELEKRLDRVLYELPNTNEEVTWADANEGHLVLGGIGSGKTSGPGRFIAMAMLKAGFGICVITVKKDEKIRWLKYAEEAKRLHDVVIFDKESKLQFNFLKYDLNERKGEGAGEIVNAINSLMNLNEQSRLFQSGNSQNQEKFWDNALRRLLSRSISILKLAGEEISIENIRRIVSSNLKSEDIKIYDHAKNKITTKDKIIEHEREEAREFIDAWANKSYLIKLLEKISERGNSNNNNLVSNYWKVEFADLSERTKSIIVESCLGLLEPFLSDGILKKQFSSGLSPELLPENIVKNKSIVIIDFGLKEYGLAGVYASSIFKMSFQAAMERRDILKEEDPKPIGFFLDEYQALANANVDTQFILTTRSSWVATVILTQNINNIKFVMGNNQPDARAKSLLNNLNLKFFAANSDYDSNKWASEMIGKYWYDFNTENYDKDKELSISKSLRLIDRFPPDKFTTLKTGRAINKFIVETVVFKAGKTWGDEEENYALVKFKQK